MKLQGILIPLTSELMMHVVYKVWNSLTDFCLFNLLCISSPNHAEETFMSIWKTLICYQEVTMKGCQIETMLIQDLLGETKNNTWLWQTWDDTVQWSASWTAVAMFRTSCLHTLQFLVCILGTVHGIPRWFCLFKT